MATNADVSFGLSSDSHVGSAAVSTHSVMRILLVTHYFAPEISAPASMSQYAHFWSLMGDEVTVLTGMPNHPTGIIPPAYRGHTVLQEKVDGYRILRTWLVPSPNKGMAKRTLSHLSFMISSVVLGGRRSGPADVVVVSSPSFFSIFSGWFLARIKRARFVIDVRDLWPGILVDLDVLHSRFLIGVLERMELAAYRAADAVVVVTDGFRQNLTDRDVPAGKVHVVRNGADTDVFTVQSPDPSIRANLGVDSDKETLVVYIGTHGLQHGLDTVLDAAAQLEDEPIRFVLIGEGADKEMLAKRAVSLGLKRLLLLRGVPFESVPGVLGAADICLLPRRDLPLFTTFIPAKLFEYLAAGRPVIGTVRGEAAGILADAGGVVVAPENPTLLADAIRELGHDPTRRATMGSRARLYAVANCDSRSLAERYRTILLTVTGRD